MDKKSMLYPRYARHMENYKEKLLKLDVPEPNKQKFLAFMTKVEADGTGEAQRLSYFQRVIPFIELIGDTELKDVTKSQMEQIIAAWRNGKNYKQSTINKSVENLKAFYRWLFDLTSQDPAPDAVRWIKREKSSNKLRAEDLWNEHDMEEVMKKARSLRDKCILSILYEAGLRPGELRGLKMRDVYVNKDMVRLYVAGKTERARGERTVPILRSYNLVRMWISQHPRRNEPDAWIWTFEKEPLKDVTLRFMVRALARKAGIVKPAYPYILRHTALTRFYKKLPGTIASKLAGHVPGSKHAETYCHLAMEDLDDSVRDMNGVPVEKREEEQITCHKCGQTLNIGDKICPSCSLVQDSEMAVKRMDDVEEALNIRAGILSLGKKYPELGELIDRLLDKEFK